jgi:hypothetical protein
MVGKAVPMLSVKLTVQLSKLKTLPYALLMNSALSTDYQIPTLNTSTTSSTNEQITDGIILVST